jgi:glycosyltransferase involved in cell wall biosynthesis
VSRFSSLCVLSYERPGFLQACIETLRQAGEPYELIVHDDGSEDPAVRALLLRLHEEGLISSLHMNAPGHNEGVGEAMRKCFAAAQGDVIYKVDQDCAFPSRELLPDGWLAVANRMFDDPAVGSAGLFAYHHDPVDIEKTRILGRTPPEGSGHVYVTDYVGSVVAMRRETYEKFGPWPTHSAAFAEDIELKKRIVAGGYELALPEEDLCVNVGFGVGPSTVVVAENTVREIYDGPALYDGAEGS